MRWQYKFYDEEGGAITELNRNGHSACIYKVGEYLRGRKIENIEVQRKNGLVKVTAVAPKPKTSGVSSSKPGLWGSSQPGAASKNLNPSPKKKPVSAVKKQTLKSRISKSKKLDMGGDLPPPKPEPKIKKVEVKVDNPEWDVL